MSTGTRIRSRRLPHWDVPGATYFVTSCLTGSIPARGLLDIARYRDELKRRECPTGTTGAEWEYQREKLAFGRVDRWLDSEPAVLHLADPRLAQLVVDSFLHFASERYELLAYVVMPSHFHWVFQPLGAWVESLGSSIEKRPPRERIMHTLKTHTALECNRLLGRSGTFWQDESFDHWVRDEDELYRIIGYVERNPVVAGLVTEEEQWLFSSARLRLLHNIRYGEPIWKKHLE